MIFIDLENTVIDTWDSGNLNSENIKTIRKFIATQFDDSKEIGIFSFAIWNEEDVDKFNTVFRPILEDVLRCKITPKIHSVEDFIKIAQNHFKCVMEFDDFFTFCRKDIFFPIFCNSPEFKDVKHFVLFDDMVQNTLIMTHDKHINLINI